MLSRMNNPRFTGEVRVGFRDCRPMPELLDEFWSDQLYLDNADPLWLTAGQLLGSIDAELAQGVAVTGTVRDGGGNPVGNPA